MSPALLPLRTHRPRRLQRISGLLNPARRLSSADLRLIARNDRGP